jgi:hypothetical protein
MRVRLSLLPPRACGGIGLRSGLKIRPRKGCGFESHQAHERNIMTKQLPFKFYCTCSEEGKTIGQDLELRFRNLYNNSSMILDDGDQDIASAVCYSLNFDFNAQITGILCDMWSAVQASTFDGKYEVRIECDRIEIGLMGVWLAFYDKFGSDGYHEYGDDE